MIAGLYTTGTAMNLLSVAFVERVSRPKFMCIGFAGVAGVLIIETALQANFLNGTNRAGQAAAVAFIFIFQFFFNCFLDVAGFVYISEIFPTHLRAQGVAIGQATNAVTNIMWLQAAPTAFEKIAWKFYLFFIIITSIAAVCVYLLCPDTAHKPLEEIAALFGDDDLVVVYQRNIHIDLEGSDVVLETSVAKTQVAVTEHREQGSGDVLTI